ncbi:MAG: methyl-accepting chemotaxis protein [Lachnospiraceae bacterium]|nr:methyl-accepting chemotaxis protein [Lachnospiraceae bacterium]
MAQKKRNGKLIFKIIYIALAALVVVSIILTAIAVSDLNSAYYEMFEEELRNSCWQLNDEIGTINDSGDWEGWNKDTLDGIMKGGGDVTQELYDDLDRVKSETGIDYTIFMGDTRAVTTLIKKGTNDRIVGTAASEGVIKDVLNGGNEYWAKSLTINDTPYCAYYVPLKNSDGSIVGMVFAGKPTETVSAAVRKSALTMIVVAVFVAVIIACLGLVVANNISKKMHSLSEEIESIAEGNLKTSLDPDLLKRNDELGAIAASLELLDAKLNDVIKKSKEMANQLQSASRELSTSSNSASEASHQISSAVDDISKGAVSQAESVETANGNTASIGDNIEEISGRVGELDKASNDMRDACDNVMAAMEKLITQNDNVTASVREIGATIESTNKSAQSIDTFSQAITDIASQTNLLSLNASIEAARAGEAGRGFAVVADEIRVLADQSRDSADKIKDIVSQLLADSEASVSVMQQLNENFSQQSGQLSDTKNDMQSLIDNVKGVSDTSNIISGRVDNLNGSKDNLVGIVSDLSAISEENAASTEETNASMQELNATFSIISDSAQDLSRLASELQETISYFKD